MGELLAPVVQRRVEELPPRAGLAPRSELGAVERLRAREAPRGMLPSLLRDVITKDRSLAPVLSSVALLPPF